MRHHVKRPLLLQSGERRAALSCCCFMMLEATFHGENERILDAPWHNARRTALNDRRSTIPLNASGGESGSDLGHAFGFPFFSFLFFLYFHVLFYFDESTLRCACREIYQRGKCVRFQTQPGASARSACLRVILQRVGETGCSLHYRKEKEKSLGRVNFESRGKRMEEDDEALQHACV